MSAEINFKSSGLVERWILLIQYRLPSYITFIHRLGTDIVQLIRATFI